MTPKFPTVSAPLLGAAALVLACLLLQAVEQRDRAYLLLDALSAQCEAGK